MSLKDQFGIPESTWRAMIRRGVISCSVAGHDEIIAKVQAKKDTGKSNYAAIQETSIEMNIEERSIYRILKRYT
jgi:hypothetical protein